MNMVNAIFMRKRKLRRGVSMMEYGVLASLIGLVALGAVTKLGGNASSMYCMIATSLSSGSSTCNGGSGTSSTSLSVVFTPANAASIGAQNADITNWMASMANDDVTSMSGLYNQYGQELTSPTEYLTSIGLDPSLYTNMVSADQQLSSAGDAWGEAGAPSSGTLYDAYQAAMSSQTNARNAITDAMASISGGTDFQQHKAVYTGYVYVPDTANVTYSDAKGNIGIGSSASASDAQYDPDLSTSMMNLSSPKST